MSWWKFWETTQDKIKEIEQEIEAKKEKMKEFEDANESEPYSELRKDFCKKYKIKITFEKHHESLNYDVILKYKLDIKRLKLKKRMLENLELKKTIEKYTTLDPFGLVAYKENNQIKYIYLGDLIGDAIDDKQFKKLSFEKWNIFFPGTRFVESKDVFKAGLLTPKNNEVYFYAKNSSYFEHKNLSSEFINVTNQLFNPPKTIIADGESKGCIEIIKLAGKINTNIDMQISLDKIPNSIANKLILNKTLEKELQELKEKNQTTLHIQIKQHEGDFIHYSKDDEAVQEIIKSVNAINENYKKPVVLQETLMSKISKYNPLQKSMYNSEKNFVLIEEKNEIIQHKNSQILSQETQKPQSKILCFPCCNASNVNDENQVNFTAG